MGSLPAQRGLNARESPLAFALRLGEPLLLDESEDPLPIILVALECVLDEDVLGPSLVA